jgi:hypothetical protein
MPTSEAALAHFYLDWKFWSVIVSLAALILSQLKPIHILLRRAKLEIEAHNRMHLTHKVGNPNASLHLIINNSGGRELKIRDITLRFKRGQDDEFVLPAASYLQTPSSKESVLFTPFKLKPQEEWAHIVQFVNVFSRQDEKQFRQLAANLRQDILAKRPLLADQNTLAAADDKNVQPCIQFFETKFRWFPGEYDLTLQIQAEPDKGNLTKRYRITLFESDSKELMDYCDDYKHGFGIYIDYSEHHGLGVPVMEA